MHHLTLLVFLILLALVAGEELVHLFFTHLAEALAWLLLLLLAVGGFQLACLAAYPAWIWFRDLVGPAQAHALAYPVLAVGVFAVPIALLLDSRRGFALTGAAFGCLWAGLRWPWVRAARWGRRYRIINAYHFAECYAPWLWLARRRAAGIPRARIQQRRQEP